MTDQEKARLEELKGKGELSPEEQAELASLEEKAKAASGGDGGTANNGKATTVKGGKKGGKANQAASGDEPAAESEVTTTFDTEGAQHVVTMRGGKAVKVWFKEGKEIGVEDAG